MLALGHPTTRRLRKAKRKKRNRAHSLVFGGQKRGGGTGFCKTPLQGGCPKWAQRNSMVAGGVWGVRDLSSVSSMGGGNGVPICCQ